MGEYPKGCLIVLRFHTSKLLNTSTTTHSVAPRASNKIKCDRAVMANDPFPFHAVKPATVTWQAHHPSRIFCSLDILCLHSWNVGIGSEAGSAKGARGGGSRNIWCDTLDLLY